MQLFLFLAAYVFNLISSAADGMVEGYEFDGRKSFERKFGVAPASFWGSRSWKGVNSLYERLLGTFDFYHVADDIRSWGYRISGIAFGAWLLSSLFEKGWWSMAYVVVYFGLGMITKWVSMWWIRN